MANDLTVVCNLCGVVETTTTTLFLCVLAFVQPKPVEHMPQKTSPIFYYYFKIIELIPASSLTHARYMYANETIMEIIIMCVQWQNMILYLHTFRFNGYEPFNKSKQSKFFSWVK